MRVVRGDYPGDSEFAKFDRDLESMSPDEMRCLLEGLLLMASPGECCGVVLRGMLECAERRAAEIA